ncbi:MAG: hypothetical protein M3547_01525, partial [Acidobacteriota bacterium]|nr:hypothetical protein [Acidobacteriota bacterium]
MTVRITERAANTAAVSRDGDKALRDCVPEDVIFRLASAVHGSDAGVGHLKKLESDDAISRTLRILSRRAPDRATRATTALDRLLLDLHGSSWTDVAWSFSRLTQDRFPVEFAFSSVDPSIRYTTEVGGPELDERERLGRAICQLQRLGAGRP